MYGTRGGTLFQTLHYNSEDRGLDSRGDMKIFLLFNFFSAALWPWGGCIGLSTLPPSRVDCREILGISTSWGPMGLARFVMG
jgi:hypothetical protein